MRILVVESDVGVAAAYAAAINDFGYTADIAQSVNDAKEAVRTASFDVVIVEPDQPDGDAFLRHMRLTYPNTAVVVITKRSMTPAYAQTMIRERVADYMPHDDIVAKPIGLEKLRQAIDGHARIVQHGKLRVDIHTDEAWYENTPLDLTPTEVSILTALMRRPDKAQSYQELVWQIYRERLDGRAANSRLSSFMMRLRRELEQQAGREIVQSKVIDYPAVGYILTADI